MLDLLLTFQFNTRLESFIAKFKTAETTRQAKSIKQQNTLVALLEDDFSPFNNSKYVMCRMVSIYSTVCSCSVAAT